MILKYKDGDIARGGVAELKGAVSPLGDKLIGGGEQISKVGVPGA